LFEVNLGKQFERPYLENIQHKKRAGGVPQLVECLPSRHEFPSSKPSTIKKENKQKKFQ
jgi:hypothetical protein